MRARHARYRQYPPIRFYSLFRPSGDGTRAPPHSSLVHRPASIGCIAFTIVPQSRHNRIFVTTPTQTRVPSTFLFLLHLPPTFLFILPSFFFFISACLQRTMKLLMNPRRDCSGTLQPDHRVRIFRSFLFSRSFYVLFSPPPSPVVQISFSFSPFPFSPRPSQYFRCHRLMRNIVHRDCCSLTPVHSPRCFTNSTSDWGFDNF